jgi:hypothetical protein
MKKITCLLLVFVCTAFIFAENNTQIFLGIDTFLADANPEDAIYYDWEKIFTEAVNPVLGFSSLNKNDGAFIGGYSSTAVVLRYSDFYLPDDVSGVEDAVSDIASTLPDALGLDSLWGIGFYLLDSDLIKIPVAVGLHTYIDAYLPTTDIYLSGQAGVGVMTGLQLYLGPINVFVQAQVSYDPIEGYLFFDPYSLAEPYADYHFANDMTVMPQIGVGFKM